MEYIVTIARYNEAFHQVKTFDTYEEAEQFIISIIEPNIKNAVISQYVKSQNYPCQEYYFETMKAGDGLNLTFYEVGTKYPIDYYNA